MNRPSSAVRRSLRSQRAMCMIGHIGRATPWLGLALATLAACGQASLAERGWLSAGQPLTAFVFLSTECPLSQNYTLALNALAGEHEALEVIGVFPLADDDDARLGEFREKYGVRFATRQDHGYDLVRSLRPSVTPEVFLVDAEEQVVYSGKIDDWAVKLGQTRKVATEHYLDDAVRAHLERRAPPVRRVEPVGCLIPEEPDAARVR